MVSRGRASRRGEEVEDYRWMNSCLMGLEVELVWEWWWLEEW